MNDKFLEASNLQGVKIQNCSMKKHAAFNSARATMQSATTCKVRYTPKKLNPSLEVDKRRQHISEASCSIISMQLNNTSVAYFQTEVLRG